MQDDFRATSRLTAQPRAALGRVSAVDRGQRPPVELRRDHRQVRRRVGRRGDRRGRRWDATCRPIRRGTSVRASASPTTSTGSGKTLVRGGFGDLLELHARRHLVVEGAEPAVPAVDVAQRRTRPPTASTCCSRTVCRRRPASIRTAPPPATTRSIFDINFRDAYARQWNFNVQRVAWHATTWWRSPYVGSQGRQMLLKGDPNQAPPVVGVTDSNVNRPYATLAPALRTIGQVAEQRARSTTTRCW